MTSPTTTWAACSASVPLDRSRDRLGCRVRAHRHRRGRCPDARGLLRQHRRHCRTLPITTSDPLRGLPMMSPRRLSPPSCPYCSGRRWSRPPATTSARTTLSRSPPCASSSRSCTSRPTWVSHSRNRSTWRTTATCRFASRSTPSCSTTERHAPSPHGERPTSPTTSCPATTPSFLVHYNPKREENCNATILISIIDPPDIPDQIAVELYADPLGDRRRWRWLLRRGGRGHPHGLRRRQPRRQPRRRRGL